MFFLNSEKKIIFCSIKKFSENFSKIFGHEKNSPAKSKKNQFQNAKISTFRNFNFFRFCGQKFFGPTFFGNFPGKFFDRAKKYFLSELRKFLGYSFDVKMSDLFIFYAFRFIRARQTRFLAR